MAVQQRVAHITTVDISLSHLLLNQLLFLKDVGYDVETISAPGPYTKRITDSGIIHHPVAMTRGLFTPFRDFRALIGLIILLRKERYDLVHVHTPKASFLGQIAARLAGTRVIVRTLHGFYFHSGTKPWLRRVMIVMERFAAQFSSMILSQNSEDIQTAIREKICPPEKIKLLGNGISLDVFDPHQVDSREIDRLRKQFDLDPAYQVIGFVGRLVAEKGVPELLQAVKLLHDQRNDFMLLLVGPVDRAKKDAITPDLAQEMGIADVCRFVGFQDQMPEVYSLMDVFVLPSHREGFPRSLMEASAMGIPGIATDIRGCREIIYPEENGILVPLNSPQALADAMQRLLDSPSLAQTMGEQGQQIAREKFDEQRVFEKVLTVYEELLI